VINDKMQAAFNEQMAKEMVSSQLYLAMAAYFHASGLDGMGRWMEVQAKEEMSHAMKFYDHLKDRMGTIVIPGIDKPKAKWASPLAAFKAALEHERFISKSINDLTELALKEKDHASSAMLQWFNKEQIEEEAQVDKIVQLLERIGDSGNGLIMLDRDLGKREG